MIVAYARSFLGTPYIWAGSSPDGGWDCSGFAQEVLRFTGVDPIGDQTAQDLYNHFSKHGVVSLPKPGALVFYGKSNVISHISICTSEYTIIEAGGGDSSCTTREIANKKGAFVRERPLTHRKDIVAIIMPNYPEWVWKEVS